MKVVNYLHTALLVSDLDRAAAFYGGILGLKRVDRNLKYPGIWYQLGSYQIHLIVHEDIAVGLKNKKQWGRNSHLALGVENIELAKTTLESVGCHCKMSDSGRKALFTQDPDGNIIEINQVPS